MPKRELSTHAHAAKLIRVELKKHGIKARVRARSYSGGSSVDVYVENLPPYVANAIDAFVSKFQYGHFDGMQDLYEYSNVNGDLPQVKFAFVHNQMSDEMRQRAFDYLREHFANYDELPERYDDASTMFVNGSYVQQEVHRVLSGANDKSLRFCPDTPKFWEKPRVRCAA